MLRTHADKATPLADAAAGAPASVRAPLDRDLRLKILENADIIERAVRIRKKAEPPANAGGSDAFPILTKK